MIIAVLDPSILDEPKWWWEWWVCTEGLAWLVWLEEWTLEWWRSNAPSWCSFITWKELENKMAVKMKLQFKYVYSRCCIRGRLSVKLNVRERRRGEWSVKGWGMRTEQVDFFLPWLTPWGRSGQHATESQSSRLFWWLCPWLMNETSNLYLPVAQVPGLARKWATLLHPSHGGRSRVHSPRGRTHSCWAESCWYWETDQWM